MDRLPHPREVPADVAETIMDNYAVLCSQWDKMYPENPVDGEHGDD